MTSAPSAPTVRDARIEDVPAFQRIYAHHVLHGVGTFEEQPPDAAELEARFRALTGAGLPWLVAERDGEILGYAYGSAYHVRSAYRFTVQDSVYIAEEARGQGLGRLLLQALIDRCAAQGYRQMVALVGGSENAGSIGLHTALGFRTCGVVEAVGLKFGRWLDVVMMQKDLGAGRTDIPEGEGPGQPVAVR
ncbi:GNAT family N-acetyltransferase [Azospirillum isscasi]|uniref:N-acetyltransferase family protein n=1 Tax=Azospirillum isscasi TaxID=3053926 RepID=A0ABU0WR16_9PROT|nr:GNAT family N-acetyltransferase [Azospirillum isscasi]MDQ2106686.1 N-acetyltransferase family protein [Azospirillum isscasi]